MPPRPLRLGDRAPSFTLKNQDGVSVSLDAVLKAGPAVLVFYPGDLTPGCTLQLSAIREGWGDFSDDGVQVFGINHADPTIHRAFHSLCRLPFDLLSDEGKKVSAAYGAVRNLFGATIIQRTVFGIGQDKIIHFLKPGMPKGSDILKALRPHLVRPTEKVV